jgi:radical SAM superfamily enzyme YgiQ (UPF0313 family)
MREPLGIECVGSVLKEKGYDIKIFQQKEVSINELVRRVIETNPQVVGFTSYSYNFHSAVEIAKKIKEKNPNILNIFGGYHITFCLDEVKNDFIDFVVRGEGELTILELINALNEGKSLENIKGIAYFDGKNIKITPERERIKSLDNLPFALRDENILKDLRVDGLMYPPPSRQKNPALIFSSRGCPYNCYYCVSPSFHGSFVSHRSPEKVVQEIKYLKDQFGTNTLFFTDLTFNLNKGYVKELCKKMIKRGTRIFWYALCRPENLDEEIVKLMKEAGCTKLCFGIDSVSDAILKRMNRKVIIERLAEIFQMVSSYGVIVRATLMIGFPWEAKNIYEYTLQVLESLPVDEVRVAIFSPYPGTIFFKKYKKYILSFNYDKYDSQTPLVKVKNFGSREIIQRISQIYKDFYFSSQYNSRMKQKIKNYPELEEAYNEFLETIKDKFI